MTVVGTRPELIRLSRIIPCLDATFDHVLVHTGQNYDFELNQIFFDELSIRPPDHYLDAAGGSAAETIARVVERADRLFAEEAPEALLVLGDTNSGLSAIPAKRRHIPIFHMEAGNRCFDFRVPEEINRKIIDHISDINLTYTENARRNLLNEGFPSDQIFVTGSPLTEVLHHYRENIRNSLILERLNLQPGAFFVGSFHREENVDDPERLAQLISSVNRLVRDYDIQMVLSVHPRTRSRLQAMNLKIDERVLDLKPLGFFDYVRLQQESFCTLSDSGTITEESSILGFPAVTLRDTIERPEGMDAGVLVMAGVSADQVSDAVNLTRLQFMSGSAPQVPIDYGHLDVSWKIAKLIRSYVPYVRRRTWGEH